MISYNLWEWLAFFYVYCFVGWCIESTIVSIDQKTPVNRGFLRGPFLPLYGFGAIVILFVSLPVRDNPFLIYFFGMIGTTSLEYLTAWLMETTLKMKYWDYTNSKFNYKGRICLTSSLFWGFLSLFMIYIIHKPIEKAILFMYNNESKIFIAAVIIVSVYFFTDSVYAFRTALDVNMLLNKITVIKNELEEQLLIISDKIENSERAIKAKERISELKAEYRILADKMNFFSRSLIKAHPNAHSFKFNDALREVRKKLAEKKSKKEN